MCRSIAQFTCNILLLSLLLLNGNVINAMSASGDDLEIITRCDLVIAGGSLSALAASLSAAASGVKTCLLEPTDWVGGQATSSGVSAIDFAWHTIVNGNKTENVASIDRDPANVTPSFLSLLKLVGDPGHCWVSPNCFPPLAFVEGATNLIAAQPALIVYYNTVVKSVTTSDDGSTITSLSAIQRTPLPNMTCNGYDQFLSQDLMDWYTPQNSSRFSKTLLQFSAPIFLDATEWGELLALSNAPYLQAMSERFDGDNSGIGNDTCGQASTLGFVETFNATLVNESSDPLPIPALFDGYWSLLNHTWTQVWTYRRLVAANPTLPNAAVGDITLQNWDHGNDNSFAYLLLSRADAASQANSSWFGGVNLTALELGEQLAYGYHWWFKSQAPANVAPYLALSHNVLGTCHGLSKIPYMRDTRRSIGLDGFVMNVTQISGSVEQVVGEIFYDRVAIGSYDCDIHAMQHCYYPPYVTAYYPVLPYYIPFRAMTNEKIGNLLLSGKTMATSFLVNAASRLHPIEWSSGTAAGAAAAYMIKAGITNTSLALVHIVDIQAAVAKFTPISWNVNGTLYPPAR